MFNISMTKFYLMFNSIDFEFNINDPTERTNTKINNSGKTIYKVRKYLVQSTLKEIR